LLGAVPKDSICICPCENVWIMVEGPEGHWKVFIPKGYFDNPNNYVIALEEELEDG